MTMTKQQQHQQRKTNVINYKFKKSNSFRVPKQKKTAYYYFSKDEHLKIRKILNNKIITNKVDDPELTKEQLFNKDNKEIQKLINERWKNLSKEQSSHYNNLANMDKSRFNKDMILYHERRNNLFHDTITKSVAAETSTNQIPTNNGYCMYPNPACYGAIPGYNCYYPYYVPQYYAPSPPFPTPNIYNNSTALNNPHTQQISQGISNEDIISSFIEPSTSLNDTTCANLTIENSLSLENDKIDVIGINSYNDITSSYDDTISTTKSFDNLIELEDDENNFDRKLFEEIFNDVYNDLS